MNGKNWTSALKDNTPLCAAVLPGAHNAGSRGMMPSACCQDGSVYEQFAAGVRFYCIRITKNKKGEPVNCHGISQGEKLKTTLSLLRRALIDGENEIFIFDIREYYPQKLGPVTLEYDVDPGRVDELIRIYLEPERYAYTAFDDVRKVKLGDIRAAGKKYILVNYRGAYAGSVACPLNFPWNKTIYGSDAATFARDSMLMFAPPYYTEDGLFWFQTQRTPNLGTAIGMKTPRRLDREQIPYFDGMLEAIRSDPVRLKRANIIAGDFMTADPARCARIIRLNLDKKLVKEEEREAFAAAFGGQA